MFSKLKRNRKAHKSPALPERVRAYAIGDIHGRADLLEKLLGLIKADARENPQAEPQVIFLGDYVDRGIDSKAVIDLVLDFDLPGAAKTCLKGNHEAMMLDFLGNPNAGPFWFDNGGLATLLSYGVKLGGGTAGKSVAEAHAALLEGLPQRHKEFLKGLALNYTLGDYFFVHAGVDPEKPLAKQTEQTMLWIRDEFLENEKPLEKTVVHGHSVVWDPVVTDNHISVDTGAYATGKLTSAVFEGQELRFIST
ncbi:MAG: serine/threonine protein phosphatase [Proteobacteria bacterium]|nr:serine/threonine protein phosphatase [Pseudomonadota bacterium]